MRRLRKTTLALLVTLIAATPLAAGPLQELARNDATREPGSGAGMPVSRDCDALFSPGEYNDRIDCKTENANVALFEYVDAVVEFDRSRRELDREPIFTDSQMEQLLRGRERAQGAKNRTHEAKTFRGQVKRQKPEDEDCYTMELLNDNKGDDIQPCVAGEDCEEVIGDGIGNDDGKCKLQGNNREVCVQVCQQPLPTDEETYDPAQAQDTEKGLEELQMALADATEETRKAIDRMRENHEATRGQDDCGMFEFDLAPTATALQVAQVAKNASGAAFNGCSVVCNQDAFGWNCEAACLVFAIIDGVLNGVNDALSIADGNNGSAQLDRVARCSEQLDDKVSGIAGSVDENAAAIDGLETQLDEVQVQLGDLRVQIDLLAELMIQRFDMVDGYLCIPQGQRECFPDGGETTSVETAAPAPAAVENEASISTSGRRMR